MGANKVGTQLLVSPHTRERILALAIVRKERLAEVSRAALEGKGLQGLERTHADELSALHAKINQWMANNPTSVAEKSDVLRDWFDNGTPA